MIQNHNRSVIMFPVFESHLNATPSFSANFLLKAKHLLEQSHVNVNKPPLKRCTYPDQIRNGGALKRSPFLSLKELCFTVTFDVQFVKKLLTDLINHWQRHENELNWKRLNQYDTTKTTKPHFLDFCRKRWKGLDPIDDIRTLRSIKNNYNIGATDVAMLCCPQYADVFRRALDDPQVDYRSLSWPEQLVWVAFQFSKEDFISGHRINAAFKQDLTQYGSIFEKVIHEDLLQSGCPRSEFWSEDEIARFQEETEGERRSTPDFLFHSPHLVCGRMIRWIEVKGGRIFPGISEPDRETKFIRQVERYVERWGSGIVIWQRDFAQGIYDHPSVLHVNYGRRIAWYDQDGTKHGPECVADLVNSQPDIKHAMRANDGENVHQILSSIAQNAKENAQNVQNQIPYFNRVFVDESNFSTLSV